MEGALEHERERDENLCPQETPARLQAPHAKQAPGDSEHTPPVRPLQLRNAATVRQALTFQKKFSPPAPEQLQVYLCPALCVCLCVCAHLTCSLTAQPWFSPSLPLGEPSPAPRLSSAMGASSTVRLL